MNISDRSFYTAPWVIAMVLVAGIVHVVSILLMPEVAPRDAFARLADATKSAVVTTSGVALLPRAQPGAELIPFEDPELAEGVCIYDLSKGLFRVRTNVDGDDFLGVSFHSRTGRIFHAMTDRSAIKGKVEIVVGEADQIEELESDEGESPNHEVRVTSPSKDGFVLIRSLAKRPSDRERAEQIVRTVTCQSFSAPES